MGWDEIIDGGWDRRTRGRRDMHAGGGDNRHDHDCLLF